MKTITITISDEQADAIEAFLRPQLRQVQDPDTGMVLTEPVYAGVADYISVQLTQMIQGIHKIKPNQAMREKLQAIRKLEKEMEEMSRPTVTVG